MFTRLSLLLAVLAITAPVIFSEVDVNEAIERCIKREKEFVKIEDKYTTKGNRSLSEPDLFDPQYKVKKLIAYDKEKTQRPFECLSDALKKYNSSSLEENDNYKKMVNECKAKQFEPKCDPDCLYRTHNGTCNNLDHPNWGASLSCGSRMTRAHYVGASGFRRSVCNNQTLPNPRNISKLYMTDLPRPLLLSSNHFIFFGQFLAHDLVDTAVTSVGEKHLECCKNRQYQEDQHPQCAPILLGQDHFYNGHVNVVNVTCFNFIRGAMCDTCSIGKRSHINDVTSYIDLSTVYSTDELFNAGLRTNDSGLLRSRKNIPAGELMPETNLIDPARCGVHNPGSGDHVRKKRDLASAPIDETAEKIESVDVGGTLTHACFEGGDRRANLHTVLMIYHTLLLRNHNRIAKTLKLLNPHWDDEKLYQEAKKINIAIFQVIVFKEYLPHLLRSKYMTEYDLWLGNGTRTKYNSTMNPSISAEFAAAAFRMHSMVDRKVSLSEPELRYLFLDTSPIYLGQIERYIAGISTTPYNEYRKQLAEDLHSFCYKERVGNYGFDLAAVNIQRGRDVGLPGYADLVRFISHGKIDIKDWDDLKLVMTPEKIVLLKQIYCHVRDIDAWIGFNSETKEVKIDLRIATTAAKIIADQFRSLKFGDRFYLENPKHFNDEQLHQLLKASLSRVFCDNSKIPLVLQNSIEDEGPKNIIVPCKLIPEVDLTPWKEGMSPKSLKTK